MTAFTCPACSKNWSVKDELAGLRGSCPHCQASVLVPTQAQPRFATGQTLSDEPPPLAEPVTAPSADSPSTPDPVALPKLDFLAPPQQPGELGWLGRYRVVKILGSGGMGLVLQADDPALKRPVALKVMRAEIAAKADNRKRFLREAQAAAALEHDHIIPIYQVGEEGGVPFIAMPLLKGEALDARLQRERKLPMGTVVRIAREVAEGLAAAHARGLIHRDIKPANIWLESRGQESGSRSPGTGSRSAERVKLLDFGLARSADDDSHITQTGAILGTPAYMAPEQALGKPVDARSDLFSLGVVLYQLLTGERPFRGSDTMAVLATVLTETPQPPQEVNPTVPAALSDLVLQLLAKEPEKRPASAQAVAKALEALEDRTLVLDTNSLRQRGTLAAPALPRWVSVLPFRLPGRTGWAIKGILCLLVLLLALFLLLPGGSGPADGQTATSMPGPTIPKAGSEKLFTTSLGMKLVLIPKGMFKFGGGRGNAGMKEVVIAQDFYLGQYEVTQWEWRVLMGNNPSSFKELVPKELPPVVPAKMTLEELQKHNEHEERAKESYWRRHPVESVSGEDCQEFLKRLNQVEKTAGWVYRLPTEAEWEYACRGGGGRPVLEYLFDYYFKEPTNVLLPDMANYQASGKNRTCAVGLYQPNRLGLYDIHGNVAELCDVGLKDANGVSQVMHRGGSWLISPWNCRAATGDTVPSFLRRSSIGLRLARIPIGAGSK